MKTTLSEISTPRWLPLVLGTLASIAAVSAEPRFTLQELPIPAGCVSSAPTQINDQGYVAGSSTRATDGNPIATVWKDGTAKVLGRLKDGTYSIATAVNSNGVAVGDGDDGDGRPLGWVTSGSTLVNFYSNNGGNTRPIAINDKGEVGGYFVKGFSSPWRGAIWTISTKDPRKSTIFSLPVLPSADPVNASAISFAFNKSNQAAGWSDGAAGQHAVLWNNDAAHSIVDLGVFGSDWTSVAFGINDIGQVVGESHPPSDSRPVLWHNDAAHTAFELPLLPGHNYGSARLINNAGTMIGFSAYDEPGTWNVSGSRIVIWIDGAVYDLLSLVDQSSGWTIVDVASINNSGQMAGLAMRDGAFKAVVLNPVP
jgi:uncharacterized membrane protein